ncbi:unnamed protein product [Didymodactylos carnosus]|uniref:General stress protein FMN-binding split barrel domain-containing protein n=1 Tax=Didymodactylos carnosus TaxID=1234261 RepID=A0A8S2FJ22_9BILA|nr:unnamed protein product [Didymodactylos carnosus]CAF4275152.1 unnamed protein product [Didymodactylos carnosus]
MTESTNLAETEKKIFSLIKSIKFAMLTTTDTDGKCVLRSCPMINRQTDQFNNELWFFTKRNSPQTKEIEKSAQVNISYSDPSHSSYVSVSGTGELIDDKAKAKQIWSDEMKAWFPMGVDDPDLILLRVTLGSAEYWVSINSYYEQM